jgi:hypothetical protein
LITSKFSASLKRSRKLQLLPSEKRAGGSEKVQEVRADLAKPDDQQNQKRISGALGTIKNICEGITGNVVAQGIISLISNLC